MDLCTCRLPELPHQFCVWSRTWLWSFVLEQKGGVQTGPSGGGSRGHQERLRSKRGPNSGPHHNLKKKTTTGL